MNLEKLLDGHYMETKYRCTTNRNNAVFILKSIPDREYILELTDGEDDNKLYTHFGGLNLDDLEELANDMLTYVKIMKNEINEKCDCPSRYCKHYESDFDKFIKKCKKCGEQLIKDETQSSDNHSTWYCPCTPDLKLSMG